MRGKLCTLLSVAGIIFVLGTAVYLVGHGARTGRTNEARQLTPQDQRAIKQAMADILKAIATQSPELMADRLYSRSGIRSLYTKRESFARVKLGTYARVFGLNSHTLGLAKSSLHVETGVGRDFLQGFTTHWLAPGQQVDVGSLHIACASVDFPIPRRNGRDFMVLIEENGQWKAVVDDFWPTRVLRHSRFDKDAISEW